MLFKGLLLFVCSTTIYSCKISIWNPFSKSKHLSALILARGGSKSIPFKNLAQIGNKTLLKRSLDVVTSIKDFDSVWVSTDSEVIARKAEKVNVHLNDGQHVSDHSKSIDAVNYFLNFHKEIDVLALIQCTSPFLKRKDLLKGVLVVKSGEECTFSVTRNSKLLWIRRNDVAFPLNFDPKHRPRRQEIANQFSENGMFYIATRKLLHSGYFQSVR